MADKTRSLCNRFRWTFRSRSWQVKAKISFEQLGQYYVPILTFGAGDQNGYDKAQLVKAQNEFDLLYKATGGTDIGIKCLLSGYMDLYGLRKTTNIDFTDWSTGSFSETVDGNIENEFAVTFDLQGRPIRIVDADNHACDIDWDAAGGVVNVTHWFGTQAQYDALVSSGQIDANTLYFVEESSQS